MPTRAPCTERAAARLVVTVDLPTPPLPAATAMMLRTPGRRGLSGRLGRPRTLADRRTSIAPAPSTARTAVSTDLVMLSRDGQAGLVSSTSTITRPVALSATTA